MERTLYQLRLSGQEKGPRPLFFPLFFPYTSLAARAEKPGMKKMLLEFAEEEKRHKERLLAVKTGQRKLTPEKEVLDLKVSDYLVEVDASDNISYQDALIVAMKKERAAFELYSDIAEKVPDANLK